MTAALQSACFDCVQHCVAILRSSSHATGSVEFRDELGKCADTCLRTARSAITGIVLPSSLEECKAVCENLIARCEQAPRNEELAGINEACNSVLDAI